MREMIIPHLRAWARLREANAARDKHLWIQAAQAYQAYLEERPLSGRIWVQAGNCLKEAGRFADALAAYERAKGLLGRDLDLYVQLGHLAKLDGRRLDAIEAYSAALEIDPGSEYAKAGLESMGGSASGRLLVNPDRDRQRNLADAALDPRNVAASAAALADFVSRLPSSSDDTESGKIPQMLHFVYGFKARGDLPYYGCMAIKSALHFNPGWKAYYYTMHEPEGPNWESIKDRIEVVLLKDFTHFGNAKLYHYAHKADIIRLLVLNHIGGAYLDIDSITQRSFEDLREHDFVMGVQAAGPDSSSGLCNAIMLGQAGAAFSTRWLAEYDHFRSKGRDDLWDYHSVKMPVRLAARFHDEITVLDYRAFFYPLWGNIKKALFSEVSAMYANDFKPAYCFHLWNGATGEWLDGIDLAYVRTSKSIYASIAREVEGISVTPIIPSLSEEVSR